MDKENKNISWSLLAKDVSGELSEQESKQLQLELESDPDVEKQVKKLWGDAGYAQELQSINTDNAWNNVNQSISQSIIQRFKWVVSAAAIIICLLASVVFLKLYTDSQLVTYATNASVEQITLPDGTSVGLNYGSTISYPKKFKGDTRQVKFSGEAFFDVVSDENMPFVIETDRISVQVLGTSFNVKDYAAAESSEVIVSTGKVRVDSKVTENNVILVAGDAVKHSTESGILEKRSVATNNYKAWMTMELEFDNSKLSDVFDTIEETYHIEIEVQDDVNADVEILNATFSQYSLEHVLESVCMTFNLKYIRNDNIYIISKEQ